MRGTPDTFWTPFPPDAYLDARQPAWAVSEHRWVRYVSTSAGAIVYVHAREAPAIVSALRQHGDQRRVLITNTNTKKGES